MPSVSTHTGPKTPKRRLLACIVTLARKLWRRSLPKKWDYEARPRRTEIIREPAWRDGTRRRPPQPRLGKGSERSHTGLPAGEARTLSGRGPGIHRLLYRRSYFVYLSKNDTRNSARWQVSCRRRCNPGAPDKGCSRWQLPRAW